MIKKKAIFFDRDDTLLVDAGYMHRIEDLIFFPDTISVLLELQKRNYLLFIITNQSGIGRGFYTVDNMHSFHTEMLRQLREHGVKIEEIAYCPHAPEDMCDCRKPSPKLLNELCLKYNIDKSQSYMVGDKPSDVESGLSAGLHTLLIKRSNSANNISKILTLTA